MEVRFTVTPRMPYRAQREIAGRIRWLRWSGVVVCVAYPLVMIGLRRNGSRRPAARRGDHPRGRALLAGLPLLQRWAAGRLLRNTPSLQGELVYRVDASGVQTRSAVGATELRWAGIRRAAETPSFFLLFQSGAMALFVPKAAFPGPSEMDAFRRLVSAGMADGAGR